MIGDPKDPGEVWKSQFQKKLLETESHIKAMIELFNELSIVGENVEEEDRVVHLLADSYSTLVTTLQAVLRMDVVTERLLHTEKKRIKSRLRRSYAGCSTT